MLLSPLTRKRVVPASVCTSEEVTIERAIEFAHCCIGSIRETGRPSHAPLRWEHVQYPQPRFDGDIGDLLGRASGAIEVHLQLCMVVGAMPDHDLLFELRAAYVEGAAHGVVGEGASVVTPG
jgi:hypothetical protein